MGNGLCVDEETKVRMGLPDVGSRAFKILPFTQFCGYFLA
jgi:hypothetical protein